MTERFVTGVVLAAGGSRRLGRPKQLLPYRGRPLLQAVIDLAGRCKPDQLIVTVGGAADEVLAAVDTGDAEVVVNDDYGSGCSSSIAAALAVVDDRCDGIVLLLGDQPGVTEQTVRSLVATASADAMRVCRYQDGRGHPFWLGRSAFDDLAALHGDKGVWKVLESGRHRVYEMDVDGPIPLDVDTWEDYEALLASTGDGPHG